MLELGDDDAGVRWNSIAPKNDTLWTIVNSFYSTFIFVCFFLKQVFSPQQKSGPIGSLKVKCLCHVLFQRNTPPRI